MLPDTWSQLRYLSVHFINEPALELFMDDHMPTMASLETLEIIELNRVRTVGTVSFLKTFLQGVRMPALRSFYFHCESDGPSALLSEPDFQVRKHSKLLAHRLSGTCESKTNTAKV